MNSDAIIDFFSGISGAAVSVYVGQPLDTIKTKLQTFPNRYKNFFDCGKQIFQQDGMRGLYAGTLPSLLANTAENGILFMAYGQCQNFIAFLRNRPDNDQLTTVDNMAAGSLAAAFSSVALCPTELVKCRIQTLKEMQTMNSLSMESQMTKKVSPIDITRDIIRKEGFRGLFRGLTTTLARECPGYGCFFGGYELSRSILIHENQKKGDIGFIKTWISGGMAGICFWLIMFPIDAIKSRIQVFKPTVTFPKYTLQIIRNEGFLALYTGLLPTLIRTFVATGALFITYEHPVISSYSVLGGASILALNCTDNLLITAGHQNFQLFSIKQIDHSTQVSMLCDFRATQQQPALPRHALQPKDVSWNRRYEHKFATTNSTIGCLYIWDATRLSVTDQLPVHNGIINRIQFHPTNPDLLLTASQDGYGKLIDLRIDNTERVAKSFRHSSAEAFRDIDINPSATDKFAAVISDQHSVPIWDFRLHHQPVYSVSTRDRVSYILWNPHEPSWLATGGIGSHDRTIR
ncbi:unnamed protein product, partial [Adineta ricciae]